MVREPRRFALAFPQESGPAGMRRVGTKGKVTKRKRHGSEQIIAKLREAEILLQKDRAVDQALDRVSF